MAAAEKHPELRQHRDGTGNSGSDRHQERVAILDVGELVGNDARQFIARKHVQQASRDGHRGMRGISPEANPSTR